MGKPENLFRGKMFVSFNRKKQKKTKEKKKRKKKKARLTGGKILLLVDSRPDVRI